MPGEKFYEGLPLADQLSRFIDHHLDPSNRHISAYEGEMLDKARERVAPSESARSPIKAVLLTGGSVILIRAAAPGLRAIRRRFAK
ncbi:MAG: hypothetical protein ACR2MB_12095 [Acidimicrobiales bacterium]